MDELHLLLELEHCKILLLKIKSVTGTMTKKDVKTNLLNHSEAKVRLLKEYLKRYLSVICNDKHTSRIKIYDMFCGEGVYENNGEGSPIVTLRQIKDVYFTNKAKSVNIPKIDCYFNDIDAKKIEKLQRVVKEKSLHYSESGDIEYTNEDYQTLHKNLLAILPKFKAQNQKAFIFIDPYKYKHIRANQIKDLMMDGNAEVLLWLPTQFMYRFANNGTPEALKDFIEELDVQYRNWQPTDNVWNFVKQLKEGFQAFLGNAFFVDMFTIKKDVNTVFCLFFFTSHIKGFEKMLEAKWEIDTEGGKGWNYVGNQSSLFHEIEKNPLEEKLQEYLKGKKRYNGELYTFTLRAGFLPKHTNEILSIWQENNKLEVLTVNGEKARKKSFYISYQHYSNDNQKVSFNLKEDGTVKH